MSDPLRTIISQRLRPKPGAPSGQQTISCPVGQSGQIVQQRSVIWDVPSQSWQTGGWVTVSNTCVDDFRPFRAQGPSTRWSNYSGSYPDDPNAPIDPGTGLPIQKRPVSDLVYDQTINSNGYSIRVVARMVRGELPGQDWDVGGMHIRYDCYLPTSLAGRQARPAWNKATPSRDYIGDPGFFTIPGNGIINTGWVDTRVNANNHNVKPGESEGCYVDVQ